MILTDNTRHVSSVDNVKEYLSLNNIANRTISELLDDSDNDILIYPHSFSLCEDKIGSEYLFSLQTNWKEKECTKAILETGNIAGFIGANGQSVSIHSRFSKNEKDFFLHYMLQKVLCLNIVNLSHGTINEHIFDFLLYLFPKLLKEALSQGIYKEYRRNEYNDANVRGTIDINSHLKTNLPFNGRIAYRTREFSYDNHVTELIRHTIDYISRNSLGKMLLKNDAETQACVAQIISATPSYNKQEREKVVKSNSKIINHPYYFRYAALQKLCLRILRHEKIKYGAKDDKIHGVLFDVSYLWEEYLATILLKQGFKHPNNKKRNGRIYLAKHNRLPRYPDFYREKDCLIIDAKYKREITRDDIHQMITYVYRLKGQNGTFIQPSNVVCPNDRYELLGYGTDDKAEIQTYFCHIPQTTNDYKQFVADMIVSENLLKFQFQHNR